MVGNSRTTPLERRRFFRTVAISTPIHASSGAIRRISKAVQMPWLSKAAPGGGSSSDHTTTDRRSTRRFNTGTLSVSSRIAGARGSSACCAYEAQILNACSPPASSFLLQGAICQGITLPKSGPPKWLAYGSGDGVRVARVADPPAGLVRRFLTSESAVAPDALGVYGNKEALAPALRSLLPMVILQNLLRA